MAGDPSNAEVWANADVYIGATDADTPIDSGSSLPNGDDYDGDWDLVGLLDGSEGFTESINVNSSDFFAWGGILVASTKNQLKVTRTFTAYEDNATVRDLWYPGSDITDDGNGGYAGTLAIGNLQKKFKIGFQVITGDMMMRVTSKNYAIVDERGDKKESEDAVATFPATVAIFPEVAADGTPVFWDVYKGPVPTP